LDLEKGIFDLTAKTDRLIIRPLQPTDYERWLEGFHNKRPQQHKYDDEKKNMDEWTQEKFNHMVRSHQDLAMNDRIYVFSIFTKNDHKNIGYVDISTIMRDEFQWGAIGYRLHNQFWRQGFAKEAVRAVIDLALNTLEFHRIEAHINLDNTASIHVAEGAGLTFECTREKFIFEEDEWTDNYVYALTAK